MFKRFITAISTDSRKVLDTAILSKRRKDSTKVQAINAINHKSTTNETQFASVV